EWLGEGLMGFSTRWGRLVGPTIMLVAVTASFMLLLYYYAYLRPGNIKAAFVASALVLPMAEGFFALRPQLIGYNFLLITLICLEHYRRGRRKVVWGRPVLFLVWVEKHGTFVFGVFVVGLFLVWGWGGVRRSGVFWGAW